MNGAVPIRRAQRNIIDEAEIEELLEATQRSEIKDALAVVEEARRGEGLDLEAAALLLQHSEPEVVGPLLAAAREVKERTYGRRVVLFAPLYTSNVCCNECLYCGFRQSNRALRRRTLSPSEVEQEALQLIRSGHRRALLVSSEAALEGLGEATCRAVDAIYAAHDGKGRIRRVNVNVAPLSAEGFRALKARGIGTYQLFQETYRRRTYRRMHLRGPKSDYDRRLGGIDKAVEAGIDDVGIGVLFGLDDARFEVLGLLQHARALNQVFGVGPHTVSVPRLEPAEGSPLSEAPPAPLSDSDFLRVVAILRLSMPYTGIILSTREPADIRAAALAVGVSQMSAGSRTNPGGYSESPTATAQFQLGDHRSLDEVIADLCQRGYLPSFCTACYRSRRTGERFMKLAKSASIGALCLPNGLVTFKEYLEDHASSETRSLGLRLVDGGLEELGEGPMREATDDRLRRTELGKRDLFL